MPDFADGLRLLGVALAEKRNDTEAIHVYEQLRLLLLAEKEGSAKLSSEDKRRLFSIDLLKATSTAKLYTWQSTHEAIGELSQLAEKLRSELTSTTSDSERAAYSELLAHTAVQLAYTYALYLSYLRHHTVAEVFGSPDAPKELRVSEAAEMKFLRDGPPEKAKPIVLRIMKEIVKQHKTWLDIGKDEKEKLESQWPKLTDGERRRSELVSRLHLVSGYANYRMAELEHSEAGRNDAIFGETFDTRLDEADKELRKADATHPNHYLVLQLLGLVYSEPRRKGNLSIDMSIAEQYFERAIDANQSDYYGHELLAGILLRRVANRGVNLANRAMVEKGLTAAQEAIVQREISGASHLLQAQFQTMLIEIERDETKRRELRTGLKQYMGQAGRFLPQAFGRPDPDLTWVRIVATTRQLGEEAEAVISPQVKADDLEQKKQQRFRRSKEELKKAVDALIEDCKTVEERWVAHQRVFYIQSLRIRAEHLKDEVEKATLANWREIQVPFI
jgi:tetratricopeptide (TPR) repeat protein